MNSELLPVCPATELAFLRPIVAEAVQRELLPRYGRVASNYKQGLTAKAEIVTEADFAVSEFILGRIRGRWPGSFSEEHISTERQRHEVLWIIDPIDGTKKFTQQRIGQFGVMAALVARNSDGCYRPIAGLIHLPLVDEWFTTSAGELRWEKAGKRMAPALPQRDTLFTNCKRFDADDLSWKLGNKIADAFACPVQMQQLSTMCSLFAALIRGELNLVLISKASSKDWDLAAGEILVRAAGGFFCDFDGKELTYNRHDLVARRGVLASCTFSKEEILPHVRGTTFP